jgi:hypothetical protein
MRSKAILALAVLLGAAPVLHAGDGVAFDSKLLHPGKIDFHLHHTPTSDDYDWMWWSPVLKGGVVLVSPEKGNDTKAFGAFFRPLAAKPAAGDLIVGIEGLDPSQPNQRQLEFQAEYRLPAGIGFGGGVVRRQNSDLDIAFGKVSYRSQPSKASGWKSIVTLQAQRIGDQTSPGGYLALFDDKWMVVGGDDGEQWRGTFGYVAPQAPGQPAARIRPAVEVVYVDNSIGDLPGPKTLFANATLRFGGGFLSHPARLGRAMGPTGLEFGNPLGYLSPTWNRRLDPWEMGGLADFRATGLETPNGQRTLTYEAVLFPFQIDTAASFLDRFFLGGSYTSRSFADDFQGLTGGYFGKIGFLDVTLGAEYDLKSHDERIHVGLIDTF